MNSQTLFEISWISGVRPRSRCRHYASGFVSLIIKLSTHQHINTNLTRSQEANSALPTNRIISWLPKRKFVISWHTEINAFLLKKVLGGEFTR